MKAPAVSILLLVVRAYGMLLYFDFVLARNNFGSLRHAIHNFPAANRLPEPEAVPRICRAVNIACICYWKQALCLQRSAVTVFLLRSAGTAAELLIGAKMLPLKSHAWVAIDGQVVNDKSYVCETFAVIDRW